MKSFFKEYSVFCSLLLILGCVFCGEIIFAFYKGRESARTMQLIENGTRTLVDMVRAVPSPSQANLEALEDNLHDLENQLDGLLRGWNGDSLSSLADRDKPRTSRDVLFNLTEFIATYKERASQSGIGLRADESFGFGQLIAAGQGPKPEEIERIYQQRLIIGALLNQLLAAAPREILAVQREEISAARYPASSVGKNDLARPMGFRLVFTGHTSALRIFLTRLSALQIPLLVRGVEVRPIVDQRRGRSSARSGRRQPQMVIANGNAGLNGNAGAEPVPIVADNLSRFAVTIEYVKLQDLPEVDRRSRLVEQPARPTWALADWKAPNSQSWNPKAIFEVFTPPLIYYHKEANTFSLTPPGDTGKDFGVELVGIERELYRIQLGGFALGPSSDVGGPIVLLYNEETGQLLRARRGQRFAQAQFALLDFQARKFFKEQPDGSRILFEDISCHIFDERLNEKVALSTTGKRRIRHADAIFRTSVDASRIFKVREGETFEVNGQKFIVRTVDPETQTVEIEKLSGRQEEPLIQVLTLVQTPASAKQPFSSPVEYPKGPYAPANSFP